MQLLAGNWIIVVPGLVVGLIAGLVHAVVSPLAPYGAPATTTGAVSHGLANAAGSFVSGIVTIAASIIVQCYTVGMSGVAWMRGSTTLRDGAVALREDAGNVLGTALILFVAGAFALALVPFTYGLSIFAYGLFLLCMFYAIPSAVVGNNSGFAAIGESFSITLARVGTTITLAIFFVVISVIGGIVAALFASAPLVGLIIPAIVSQAVGALCSLIVVGEYLNLRGTPEPPTPVY